MKHNIASCNALFTILIEQLELNLSLNQELDVEGYKNLSELLVKFDSILTLLMPE